MTDAPLPVVAVVHVVGSVLVAVCGLALVRRRRPASHHNNDFIGAFFARSPSCTRC